MVDVGLTYDLTAVRKAQVVEVNLKDQGSSLQSHEHMAYHSMSAVLRGLSFRLRADGGVAVCDSSVCVIQHE